MTGIYVYQSSVGPTSWSSLVVVASSVSVGGAKERRTRSCLWSSLNLCCFK